MPITDIIDTEKLAKKETEEETEKKPILFYVKTAITILALFVESVFLSDVILSHIRSENYFSPPIKTLINICALMLAISYSYSLTIGAWEKRLEYIIVPAPVSLGILYVLFFVSPFYAIAAFLVSYGIMCSYINSSVTMMRQLIKINPRLIFKFSSRGMMLVFSLLGGFIVLLHGTFLQRDINIGKIIGEIAQEQLNKVFNPKPGESGVYKNLYNILESKVLPYNPELFSQLSGMQIESTSPVGNLGFINIDITKSVTDQINKVIEPYKHFIPPLLAVVTVMLLELLGFIANSIFLVTIGLLFYLAKKVGFFKVEEIDVKQEKLVF